MTPRASERVLVRVMRLGTGDLALAVSTLAIASIHARASAQTATPDAGVALSEAVDLNADPHIVEINLESMPTAV